MHSVAECIATNYSGSQATRDAVRAQIAERFGEEEAEKYDPYTNARTFAQWAQLGYTVKKGQTALRSVTYIEKKDARGTVIKIPRVINLFYVLQVDRV